MTTIWWKTEKEIAVQDLTLACVLFIKKFPLIKTNVGIEKNLDKTVRAIFFFQRSDEIIDYLENFSKEIIEMNSFIENLHDVVYAKKIVSEMESK